MQSTIFESSNGIRLNQQKVELNHLRTFQEFSSRFGKFGFNHDLNSIYAKQQT